MNDAVQDLPSPEQVRKQRILDEVKKELKKVRSYTPKVGVFGDTGVGKSTLCNALFGKDIAKISDVEACTREPQEVLVGNEDGGGIILVDVPGVGEDAARHQEYIDLYKSLVPELDLVLWAIKSDDRKYMSSIDVYKEVLEPNLDSCPVVFTITQSEKIEPWGGWDSVNNKPGEAQQANLQIKINDVSSRFNVSTNKIVTISSGQKYNLVELVNKVVEVLPNEKKYSFTREAKEENVSEEAAKSAEKGIFDHIKEKIGDAWDYVKDDVLEAAKDFVVKYAPKIAKKAISWLKKWF
ncbi:MAG: 50S ribosome-binding GTPase [Shewanella algae]